MVNKPFLTSHEHTKQNGVTKSTTKKKLLVERERRANEREQK